MSSVLQAVSVRAVDQHRCGGSEQQGGEVWALCATDGARVRLRVRHRSHDQSPARASAAGEGWHHDVVVSEHAPERGERLPAPGTWVLRRRVLDRVSGRRGHVRGLLEVSADGAAPGGGQRWSETGVLRWDGEDHAVTRTLLLRPRADGAWWMHFADGRPFHPWCPGEPVDHPCAADVYHGRIDVGPRWMAVHWEVSGPGKDQLFVTTLDLVDAAAPSHR